MLVPSFGSLNPATGPTISERPQMLQTMFSRFGDLLDIAVLVVLVPNRHRRLLSMWFTAGAECDKWLYCVVAVVFKSS